jgi:clan AA aspartic protease (TIGR02281 family)
MRSRAVLQLFLLVAVCAFHAAGAEADTVRLKGGTEFEGIIIKEDDRSVEFDIGGGTMTIGKENIASISRSAQGEKALLKDTIMARQAELASRKEEFAAERRRRLEDYGKWVASASGKTEDGLAADEIRLLKTEDSKDLLVETVINGSAKATLILDTGAPHIILTRRIGDKLGVDFSDLKKDVREIRLAGRKRLAKIVKLESVRLQGIEEKDLIAGILVDEEEVLGLKDGLLGMSFLNRFDCVIDLDDMVMRLKSKAR